MFLLVGLLLCSTFSALLPVFVSAGIAPAEGQTITDPLSAVDPPAAALDTVPGGIISGNTTWSSAGSPYILTSDLLVTKDATLTVEPGVEVRSAGNYCITVEGGLNASGTPSSPILFTSNSTTPSPGDWFGIGSRGNSSAITLVHSVIEYADYAVYDEYDADLLVDHCTITSYRYYGVYMRKHVFSGMAHRGVVKNSFINGSYPHYYGDSYGIYVESRWWWDYIPINIQIENNTVRFNYYGIYTNINDPYALNLTVARNNVTNNVYGMYESSAMYHGPSNITITQNYIASNQDGLSLWTGLSGGSTSVEVSNNNITLNSGVGIEVGGWGTDGVLSITGNVITGNDIGVYGYRSDTSNVHIHFNDIYDSTSHDFRVSSYNDWNATHNYWGTTNATIISECIYDFFDDFTVGRAYYSPALNASILGAFEPILLPAVVYPPNVITVNTTWTLAASPYILDSSVFVMGNATLTVEPGVEVRFAGYYYIMAEGALNATGAPTSPILFTSNSATPSPWDWFGIRSRGNSSRITLARCVIEFADHAVYDEYDADLLVDHCSITSHGYYGVYMQKNFFSGVAHRGVVKNSLINGSYPYTYYYGYGIYVDISRWEDTPVDIRIEDNTIRFHQYGICLYPGGYAFNLTIARNTVTDNYYGITHYGYIGYSSSLTILQNNVTSNQYGLKLSGGLYLGSLNVFNNTIASNQYEGIGLGGWGTGGSLNVTWNLITGNGIGLYGERSETSGVHIHLNDIYDSISYDFRVESSGDWNATQNYWGTTNTTLIDENIYDSYDKVTLGKVHYVPFLTSAVFPLPLFEVHTDKPVYIRGEVVTLTATCRIGYTWIDNGTVLFQVDYPNNTLFLIWAEKTDAKGTASLTLPIGRNYPVGLYSVYATFFKIGMENVTATTSFNVFHFQPNLQMSLEAPGVSLIGQYATVALHVLNVGNETASNVHANLNPPGGLIVSFANTSYIGSIAAGEEITLLVNATALTPSQYTFTANATYTTADGTPMPPVSAQITLVYAYHTDYPVDLTKITVIRALDQIIVNLTIVNYGDHAVEVTLIASARHTASKLALRSSYQAVLINPGETLTVKLTLSIPTTAPPGEYTIQGILATELPRKGGFAPTHREETLTV